MSGAEVRAPQPPLHHPVVVEHAARRAADAQLRIADAITAFAGSMPFVYIHAAVFACWMLFVESDPWPRLTLIVSLEAIFLSTFVMISQNRADAKRQVIADQQWTTVQEEDKQNQHLIALSNQILQLTREVHAYAAARSNGQVAPDAETAQPENESGP
jgi:uncharacterized membrane protein